MRALPRAVYFNLVCCSEKMSCTRSQRKRSLEQTDHVEYSQELPSSKKKNMGTKRRRSSFMRGRNRRSLPPANLDISELHKKIPPDEAEEKRLALLHQVCFEYTLNRLEEEMPQAKGFEELKNAARSAFNETLDKLEKDNCLKESCSTLKRVDEKNRTKVFTSIPNPVNLKIEGYATRVKGRLDHLMEESTKWDNLLTSSTEMATQAESLVKMENPEGPGKLPDSLSRQDVRYLTGLPNLNQILSSSMTSLQKLEMHVDTILQSCKGLKELEASTDSYLTHQIKLIAKKSETATDFSPKSLICGKST
ncbi:uncharacterized protein LOC117118632 [Anneissia japonica]|uniref:uncharacterized protein LOC117118632 n=1 Tax=Anneissia japonica TaxID=1529436 RepID=UPI00142593B3|nr:uncharacterized protein LOC117118632 [Anneissia japonica]